LLLIPLAALAGESQYWGYTFRNVEVTAAGNGTYAVNLARYCVRLDGMLRRILGIDTSERPPVHLYALPHAQVRQLLGDEDLVSYRITNAGVTILISNVPGSDSDYWGAYFGYTAALLETDDRLRGPDWYSLGLPLVFASTKYQGNRAQLGLVERSYALTLGQGSALIPMRSFLSLKREAIYSNAATRKIYDAEAWGLAHEVFVEGWRRAEFTRYLQLMRRGSSEADAFAAAFKVSYEQLDKDFYSALRQRVFVYTMDAPDPDAAGAAAQPLGPEELKARLDLLASQYAKRGQGAQ
jgi:hypothetical protein